MGCATDERLGIDKGIFGTPAFFTFLNGMIRLISPFVKTYDSGTLRLL